jgi:hypothetical protein
MKYTIHFLLLLLLGWVNCFAQLNESDTVKFQLRSSVMGNYQQGNVDILTIRSRLDFTWSPVKHIVFKAQNSSLYQEFSSVKADNDIFSRNYFYYNPQHRVYPFAIAYVSANYRRKIDSRIFAGAGITWQLLNKKYHVLKLSASTVYEANRFKGNSFNYDKYNGDYKIDLWRGTLYIAGWNYLFNNKLRLYYDAYWQPDFADSKNYRTQFDMGLDFPLYKGLNITTLYSFTHENVVVNRVKEDDKILTFGLSYTIKTKHQ